MLFGQDLVGYCIEAFASPKLVDQSRYIILWVIENGFDQGMKCAVPSPRAVDTTFIHTLAAVIRVGIIYTLGPINLGAGSTCGRIAVTFTYAQQVISGCPNPEGTLE